MNAALLGNRAFAGGQVKIRSLGWALVHYDCVFRKRRNLDTETVTHGGGTLYEHEGRDWGDTSTNEGPPKVTGKPPETRGGAWNIFSLTSLRRNQLG